MNTNLMTEIKTFLDNTGFTQYQQEMEKMKNLTKGFGKTFKDMFNFKKAFGGVLSNPLTQLVGGYFTLTGAVGQYNKMVDASNKQIALETQMDTVLKTQGYYDSQIQGLKDYMGELQNAGVIGDEASLVAVKQMANFKLQEQTIRQLLPQVHNLMVSEKGLASTEADAEKWSKALSISIASGQTRALKQAGIIFDEHKQKVFESANEQQRASMLYKELTERIGDQNAEILKTPEGKIINAQNRIGDTYERFGFILRETRGKFWQFMADNLDLIAPFTEKVIKALTNGFDTGINTVQFLFKTFANMPTGTQNAIKLLTGFFLVKKFPIAGGILIIEDIFAAFQGKDSLIEDVFNKMTDFFNSDYKFSDLRQGVWDFWDLFIKGADSGIEKINLTTKVLSDLLDLLKGGTGLLQMIFGVSMGLPKDIAENAINLVKGEELKWDDSVGNIKGGWNKIKSSYEHMGTTDQLHENYLFEEAVKQQQEQIEYMNKVNEMAQRNKQGGAIPLAVNEKFQNAINNPINNYSNFNKINNIKEVFQEQPKKELPIPAKEVREKITTNNAKVEIHSNPIYNINIENKNLDDEALANKIKNKIDIEKEKELKALQIQYGAIGATAY